MFSNDEIVWNWVISGFKRIGVVLILVDAKKLTVLDRYWSCILDHQCAGGNFLQINKCADQDKIDHGWISLQNQ